MKLHHCPKRKRKRLESQEKSNMASPMGGWLLRACLKTVISILVYTTMVHFQCDFMIDTAVKAVVGFMIGKILGKCMVLTSLTIMNMIFALNKSMPCTNTCKFVWSQTWNMAFFLMFIPCIVAPNPNQQKDYDVLPGMKRWNGIPFHDFALTWWIALGVALGSIAQDGWTLLQTAQGQDAGAPGQGGNAQQQQQSANRNIRLFNCILNYIENSSSLYRYVVANFGTDGRGLYNYLAVFGVLPYSQEETQSMEAEWEEANMSKVGIDYDASAPFLWEEWVKNLQRKLGKTNAQARTKFLRGFPASFNLVIVPEQMAPGMGNYVFPANFPAHHPQGGNPDPNAGEPDIHAMAMAFYPTWSNMIKLGQIRSVPKGMARSAQGECLECSDSDDGDNVAYQIRRMNAEQLMRIICVCCGGIGHFARSGNNKCLTLLNGVNVPKEDLQNIQYPNGLEPPKLPSSSLNTNRGPGSRPKSESASRLDSGKFRSKSNSRTPGKPAPRRTEARKPNGRAKSAEAEETTPNGSTVQDAEQSDSSESGNSASEDHQVKWAVAFRNIVVQ